MEFSPFFRQVFVAIGPQLGALSVGASVGYPCVLLQQLNSNESSIRPDLDTMTWITSMYGIVGVGATLMPSIMQLKGRKFTYIGSCLVQIIGWCLMVTAVNAYMVLLAEMFMGLGSNCMAVANLMTISEMLAPKYRTVSMMLIGISQSLGIVIVTTVGTFIHWKTMAMIMCIPVVTAVVMIFLWPESPAWLIYKGKFEKSEKSFTWLRGSDDDAKRELQVLMIAQKENQRKPTGTSKWQEMIKDMKMRDFYMPSLHMLLILVNFYGSGALCILIYSRDIMETATGDPKAALFGYLMISVTFGTGAIFSLVCIRYLNSKTILYIGSMCNVFMIVAAIVSILQSFELISKNPYIFVGLFLSIMTCFDSGFNTMSFTIAIELMPVKHRGKGGALYNIITCFLYFVTVKSLPYMLLYLKVWGTFLIFAATGITCTLLIHKYVPEPKGKTLQEIEDYYNYGYFNVKRDLDVNVEACIPIVKCD